MNDQRVATDRAVTEEQAAATIALAESVGVTFKFDSDYRLAWSFARPGINENIGTWLYKYDAALFALRSLKVLP